MRVRIWGRQPVALCAEVLSSGASSTLKALRTIWLTARKLQIHGLPRAISQAGRTCSADRYDWIVGKKDRIKRERTRRKKEKAAAEPPADGPRFMRIGGMPPIYMDAEANSPIGIEIVDGKTQQIGGRFKHTPGPGPNYAYIRNMVIGMPGGPLPGPPQPTAQTPTPVPPQSARRCFGYNPREPGRRCVCGFAVYLWQRTCPKCNRSLADG